MKKIDVDKDAGFCFGVVRAIQQAENALSKEKKLYCLGDIVHNEQEIIRLQQKGLEIINREQFLSGKYPHVMIRAHGEPPQYYTFAKQHNITLVDATCPIVIHLQQKIKDAWDEMNGVKGQVIIFGEKYHAEISGLNGQIDNHAIIIESDQDIDQIDFKKPIRLFSQTTKSVKNYNRIAQHINERALAVGNDNFIAYNTICSAVSIRSERLKAFAKKYDIIIFVSGRNSSNGKSLFEICYQNNPNSHHIAATHELQLSWFKKNNSVGITGGTSTPQWLMQQTAFSIKKMKL